MNKKLIGFSSLFLTSIVFGSFGVWIRLLNQVLTIYQQIVFRNLIALVFAIGIIFLGKRFVANFNQVKKVKLLFYSFSIPLSVIFYNIGILNTKISVVTFAFYIGTILFSWIFSFIFFKETLTLVRIIKKVLYLNHDLANI